MKTQFSEVGVRCRLTNAELECSKTGLVEIDRSPTHANNVFPPLTLPDHRRANRSCWRYCWPKLSRSRTQEADL
jgi:hypothetical protein